MRVLKIMLVLLFIAIGVQAKMGKMYQSVSPNEATLLQSGKTKLYCPNCGMNLVKFYKTSHVIKQKNGSYKQFCSLHCLVEEFEMGEHRGMISDISEILVADAKTNKMIKAKKAYYVVGSKIKGTMTINSKYAFANKADAETFAKANGGKIVSFDEAYMIALNDFKKDLMMIKKKRGSKMWKMGKKMYSKKCDSKKIDSIKAHNIAELKAAIRDSGACPINFNDKQLQAVSLYVWDIKLKNFEKRYSK